MRIESAALVLAVAAGLAAPLQATSASTTDAFVLYSAGTDGLLNDPKDSGLHQALVLMEENGLSLPPDVGEKDKFAIGTVVRLLLSEIDFRVAMRLDAAPNSIPFSLTIRSSGNAGATPDETAFVRGPLRRTLQTLGLVDIHVEPFDFLYPAAPESWFDAVEKVAGWLEATPGIREIAGSLLITAKKPAA